MAVTAAGAILFIAIACHRFAVLMHLAGRLGFILQIQNYMTFRMVLF